MFVADPGEKLVLEARTGWILPSDLLKTSFLMVPSSTLPGINMEVENHLFVVDFMVFQGAMSSTSM